MKKGLLIVLVALLVSTGAWAQKVTEDKEVKTLTVSEENRLKLGILLGYPSGVTLGYSFSNWFEGNITAGYNFINYDSGILSANGLFTLVNIPIGKAGVMPLSLGPQVNFIFGGVYFLDVVADLRLEYTFSDIPLNLFGEFGFGVRFFDPDQWYAFNGGIGVRYVF